MMFIFKAKKMLPGTRRKWKDGVYVKGTDHLWHKEKAKKIAHEVFKEAGQDDPETRKEFQEVVWNLIEHLHEENILPASANDEALLEFFSDAFEDEDWHKDKGFKKFAKFVHDAATRFHEHLTEEGRRGPKVEANKPSEKGSFQFKNPIHHAEAKQYISKRFGTFEAIKATFDGVKIIDEFSARRLIGFTVEVGGVKGVVVNFYKQRTLLNPFTRTRTTTGIPLLVMLTEKGKVKVPNEHPITVIADPTGEADESTMVTGGPLAKVGISEIIFDADIAGHRRYTWQESIRKAFIALEKKLDLNLNGKVKIQVYGKRGPKRGALADYSSHDKIIRLSTAKTGSREALAHELGHAVDDKLSHWRGCNTFDTHAREIVRAFRASKQGQDEAKQLKDYIGIGGARRGVKSYYRWRDMDREIFARCFETYVATVVKEWEKEGWAKKAVDDESFKEIKPIFDRLFKDDKIKKALTALLEAFGGSHG